MKKQNGITLIALVITIIVLLILAGISILIVVGDNGLLSKAVNSKELTLKSSEKEYVNIAYDAAIIEKNGGNVTAEDLQVELDKLVGDGKTKVEDIITELNVQFIESKNFYSIVNGEIKETIEPIYVDFVFDSTNYYMTGIQELSGEIIIPDIFIYENILYKVTEIGEKAFYNLTGITKIYIPDTVHTLGKMAFQYCNDLEYIKMSNNLIQINNNAFYSCPKLKSIYIPKTLTSIGVNAFAYCSSLENVILENGLESFCPPQASFAGCPKLIEIEFPDSISSFNM